MRREKYGYKAGPYIMRRAKLGYWKDLESLDMQFIKHNDNRQRCTCCGRNIPNYVKRISFSRSCVKDEGRRICELCILNLSKLVDKQNIEKWRLELFINGV